MGCWTKSSLACRSLTGRSHTAHLVDFPLRKLVLGLPSAGLDFVGGLARTTQRNTWRFGGPTPDPCNVIRSDDEDEQPEIDFVFSGGPDQ